MGDRVEGDMGGYMRQCVIEIIPMHNRMVHMIRLQQTRHLPLRKPHVLRNRVFQGRGMGPVGRRRASKRR